MIKTPRLYFYDSGLVCWLLSIQNAEQLNSHSMRGPIFESFIISEFLKSSFNSGTSGFYYFWRDRSGNEIDILIEEGEKLQPIEIKSGQTVNNDYFTGLNRWIQLAGKTAINPVLIYGGDDSFIHTGIKVFSWKDKELFRNS